jgi:hypothetical protein
VVFTRPPGPHNRSEVPRERVLQNTTEDILRAYNSLSDSDRCIYRIGFNGTLFAAEPFSTNYCTSSPAFV